MSAVGRDSQKNIKSCVFRFSPRNGNVENALWLFGTCRMKNRVLEWSLRASLGSKGISRRYIQKLGKDQACAIRESAR